MEVIQNEIAELSPLLFKRPLRFYDAIETCFESANSSWICADACLNEKEANELREVIEACLTNAEVCAATARMLARGEDYPYEMTLKQLNRCILASMETSEECLRFSERHEHCQIAARCAEQCYRICMNCVQELQSL